MNFTQSVSQGHSPFVYLFFTENYESVSQHAPNDVHRWQDSSLRVHAMENVSLNARDDSGNVTARMSVGKTPSCTTSIPLIDDADGDEELHRSARTADP